MDTYMSPAWTVDAISDDLGSWLMPIDWITIVATAMIAIGTTLATDNA